MSKDIKRYNAIRAEAVKWVARHSKINCTEVYVRGVLNDRNKMSPLAELIRKSFAWKMKELKEAQQSEPEFLK